MRACRWELCSTSIQPCSENKDILSTGSKNATDSAIEYAHVRIRIRVTLKYTRRWHVTISCQPDGRPPQPVRPWKSGRVHLAEGSNVVVLEQEIRSVELGVCPNATFSFFDHVIKIG